MPVPINIPDYYGTFRSLGNAAVARYGFPGIKLASKVYRVPKARPAKMVPMEMMDFLVLPARMAPAERMGFPVLPELMVPMVQMEQMGLMVQTVVMELMAPKARPEPLVLTPRIARPHCVRYTNNCMTAA